MRVVVRTSRFDRELQRLKRRGYDVKELQSVVELLVDNGELPTGYHPHRLTGEWAGVWECHIEPDWLLIYEVSADEVFLHRTGSHQDLFG